MIWSDSDVLCLRCDTTTLLLKYSSILHTFAGNKSNIFTSYKNYENQSNSSRINGSKKSKGYTEDDLHFSSNELYQIINSFLCTRNTENELYKKFLLEFDKRGYFSFVHNLLKIKKVLKKNIKQFLSFFANLSPTNFKDESKLQDNAKRKNIHNNSTILQNPYSWARQNAKIQEEKIHQSKNYKNKNNLKNQQQNKKRFSSEKSKNYNNKRLSGWLHPWCQVYDEEGKNPGDVANFGILGRGSYIVQLTIRETGTIVYSAKNITFQIGDIPIR